VAVTIETNVTHTLDTPLAWSDFTHTGPDTLAGRYMRLHWQPICHVDDVPPGRAKPYRIMSEDLTVYRGEGGAAHVVAFRCAHRGTQLSTGWVEGDNLRCFYHGWMYDGSGQCVEQPAEPEPFCNRIKIRAYPTQEYLGLVWAYLGEGEAPPFRRIPQLERESDLCIQVTLRGRVQPFNYVNNMENDPGHVPFVHRGTLFFTDIPQIETEETPWGIRDRVVFENRVGLVHRVMPNARFFTIPVPEGGWTEFLLFMVPVDDDSHTGFGITMNHLNTKEGAERFRERIAGLRARLMQTGNPVADAAAAVLRGELRIEDMEDRTNVIQVQDAASQWGQGSIRTRLGEHLGRSDVGVLMLRRVWERELRALAEGRPLKQWQIPDEIDLASDYHG
jgi:5,5'-dehydrodivanillate O-demethylase